MSLKYRPEIDGLRTIAVCSVLIYHAKFTLNGDDFLPGGFLGVDIFFVISGFLITSLIVREWDQTGRFSILNFYDRRARRLLPALFVVILACLPAAWFILLPSQMIDFIYSMLGSLAFVSNMYWYFSLQAYGAESGLIKPLLHTWSLAVEEQFYIFFPLLYLLALRRVSRFIPLLGILLVGVCLALAEFTTQHERSLSFYWLLSRLWELLAGGLLAHLLFLRPNLWHFGFLRQTMPSVGMILILTPLFFGETMWHHPGLTTVPTILGTILVIWFSGGSDWTSRILKSRLFVSIGLISYSLYLWHYPIFAFGRLIAPEPLLAHKVVWFALSFALATFSYWLIESPFRDTKRVPWRPFLGGIAACLIGLGIFSATMIQQDGRRERFPDLIAIYGPAEFDNAKLQDQSWEPLEELARSEGFGPSEPHNPSRYEAEKLWFDMEAPGRKVLLLGNSHSKDMFNVFHLNRELFPGIQFTRFGMRARLPDEHIAMLLESPNFEAADTVILAFSFGSAPVLTQRLPVLLERLEAAQKTVVIMANSTAFKEIETQHVFDWYIQSERGLADHFSLNQLGYENRDLESTSAPDDVLVAIAEDRQIPVLTRSEYICDDASQSCEMTTPQGRKVFFDRHHYSLAGAQHLAQRIYETGWLELP